MSIATPKYAILVAGGSGTRMNADAPKQFLSLRGRSVLHHSLDAFLAAYDDWTLIVVLPEAHREALREQLALDYPATKIITVSGGATRFHSVKAGLSHVGEEGVVLVHDAVRCLVSPDLIRRVYEAARQTGSAVPVIPARDSIRMLDESGSRSLPRQALRLVQTPQAFSGTTLIQAFRQPYEEGFTDEASVIERAGFSLHLVEGEERNIKLTYPSDLLLAEQFLSFR